MAKVAETATRARVNRWNRAKLTQWLPSTCRQTSKEFEPSVKSQGQGKAQWRTQEFSKDQGITLRGASRSAGAPSPGHWRDGRRHRREGRRHWLKGRHYCRKRHSHQLEGAVFLTKSHLTRFMITIMCWMTSVTDPVVPFVFMLTIAILINDSQIIDMRSAVALISFFSSVGGSAWAPRIQRDRACPECPVPTSVRHW